MFLVWQHLIRNAPQPGMDTGCSAHASEQPWSPQIPIFALIWSRTGAIHCPGMATDLLCVCLQTQVSSERPGAQQGQGGVTPKGAGEAVQSLPKDFTPGAAGTHPMSWLRGSTKDIFNKKRARSR